jgi:hypothetical protein
VEPAAAEQQSKDDNPIVKIQAIQRGRQDRAKVAQMCAEAEARCKPAPAVDPALIAQLISAADKGDTAAVAALIGTQKVPVNSTADGGGGGGSALQYAAQKNRTETASLLLKSWADIEQADADGVTPLLVSNPHLILVILVILTKSSESSPDPHLILSQGAVLAGATDCVDLLLAAGGNWLAEDKQGRSVAAADQAGGEDDIAGRLEAMKAVEMWAAAHPEGPPRRPKLEPTLDPEDPASSLGLDGSAEEVCLPSPFAHLA